MGKNSKFHGFYVVNAFPTSKKIYPLNTQRKKRLTNWYILVYSVKVLGVRELLTPQAAINFS